MNTLWLSENLIWDLKILAEPWSCEMATGEHKTPKDINISADDCMVWKQIIKKENKSKHKQMKLHQTKIFLHSWKNYQQN